MGVKHLKRKQLNSMKTLCFLLALSAFASNGYTQEKIKKKTKSETIHTQESNPNSQLPASTMETFRYVEQMPDPRYDINKYIAENLKYPDSAIAQNIEGRVNVQFVVEEDGRITNAKLIGNKRLGGGCEEEAVRVVSSMPPWKPGKQNGRAVRVYYTIPVSFKLEN
jgi:TonB family protein